MKKRKDLVDIFEETEARLGEGLQIIFKDEDENFDLIRIFEEIENENQTQCDLVPSKETLETL